MPPLIATQQPRNVQCEASLQANTKKFCDSFRRVKPERPHGSSCRVARRVQKTAGRLTLLGSLTASPPVLDPTCFIRRRRDSATKTKVWCRR